MKKQIVNLVFLMGCFLFLSIGLIKTVFFPKEINYYENRYAEKIKPVSISAILDTSFQDNWEAALADQVLFSQTMKKAYNDFTNGYQYSLLQPLLKLNLNRYINFNSHLIFNGNICYGVRSFSKSQPLLDKRIENCNRIISSHPETDFYIYYIEKDTDINFETNEIVPFSDYIFEHVNCRKTAWLPLRSTALQIIKAGFIKQTIIGITKGLIGLIGKSWSF